MKQLSYQTLKEQNYSGYLLESAPERVLQFGEGNFLRAFVDYFIDVMNEKAGFNSKVVLCQPIAPGLADMINEVFTPYFSVDFRMVRKSTKNVSFPVSAAV